MHEIDKLAPDLAGEIPAEPALVDFEDWDGDAFTDDDPVSRSWLSAAETLNTPPPVTTAPRSIFDLAPAVQTEQADPRQGDLFDVISRAPVKPLKTAPEAAPRIEFALRGDGRVRVSGLAYPSGRWTAEREEQERARRARQIVPRPSREAAGFRIRGK